MITKLNKILSMLNKAQISKLYFKSCPVDLICTMREAVAQVGPRWCTSECFIHLIKGWNGQGVNISGKSHNFRRGKKTRCCPGLGGEFYSGIKNRCVRHFPLSISHNKGGK